jgi:hypothetical protein
MKIDKPHKPISCAFYHYLEADASLNKVSSIEFVEPTDPDNKTLAIIKDFKSIMVLNI